MDAVDLLLRDKQHPNAQKLLTFHHANAEFLTLIVAELRLLRRLGRKDGSIESVVHFLRWEQPWHGDGEFEINDQLTALAGRICALLWPDLNRMLGFIHCEADEILDIGRGGKRYGSSIIPGERTLDASCCSFLPIEEDATGTGLVRPIQMSGYAAPVMPPPVPVLDRPATVHPPITETEAASIVEPLRRLVGNSPNPKHPILVEWLRHIEAQPEVFLFMQSKLQQREAASFSARSILDYCRWSIRRAAISDKRFTLPSRFNGLYCRALILLNPRLNGYCKFKDDGKAGRSNQLLGCTLLSERVDREPYFRLVSARGGQ